MSGSVRVVIVEIVDGKPIATERTLHEGEDLCVCGAFLLYDWVSSFFPNGLEVRYDLTIPKFEFVPCSKTVA